MAKLRSYRIKAKLSQAQLAAAAGCNPSYISFLERGIKRNPGAATALAITRVLSDRLGTELTIGDVFGIGGDQSSSQATKSA